MRSIVIFGLECLLLLGLEKELLELKKRLDETCIPHKLITDAGNTEFHGVPTVTCLGIGPYISEEIDKFTDNLPLI